MDYYTLKIAGLTRNLPVQYISRKTRLANFSFLGDVELVDPLADIFTKYLKGFKFNYLVTPQVKVTPLVHGIAKRLGHKRYVVCRKSVKAYMTNPLILKPQAHFPKHVKQLVLNGADRNLIKGKHVAIVEDVVSTGVTLRMTRKLMEMAEAKVICTVAVLKQGDTQFDQLKDFYYLAELPIFKDE